MTTACASLASVRVPAFASSSSSSSSSRTPSRGGSIINVGGVVPTTWRSGVSSTRRLTMKKTAATTTTTLSVFSIDAPAPARYSSTIARAGVDDFDLDALMPDTIDGDLEGLQDEAGAAFDDDGLPLNYGDADAEAEVIRSKVGILDRSGRWSLLRVAGPGAVAALESAGAISDDVAALIALQPGEGAPLRFTFDGADATGMAHVQGGGLLLILPSTAADAVTAAAAAANDVELMDLAEQCVLLSILGPGANDMLEQSGIAGVLGQAPGVHNVFGFEGRPVVAAHGVELGDKVGATANLVVDEGVAGLVWAAMTGKGAEPVGWEALDAVVDAH